MKDISDRLSLVKPSNYLNPQRFYNDFLDYLVVLDELHVHYYVPVKKTRGETRVKCRICGKEGLGF